MLSPHSFIYHCGSFLRCWETWSYSFPWCHLPPQRGPLWPASMTITSGLHVETPIGSQEMLKYPLPHKPGCYSWPWSSSTLLAIRAASCHPFFGSARHESVAHVLWPQHCGHILSSLKESPSSPTVWIWGESHSTLQHSHFRGHWTLRALSKIPLKPPTTLSSASHFFLCTRDGCRPRFFHCLFSKSHLVLSHLTLECDTY